MFKCTGCGVELQNVDEKKLGYTKNLNNNLCERCFRIRNYNDYKFVIKNNEDFINILKDVNTTNDLVVLVVDLFNISSKLEEISKYINNNILLVLTKRDLLPKSCYDLKFKSYFEDYNLNIIDTVVISSVKNYNFDELYNKINEYKITKDVYVVGFTNSGKSTMINKIIYNYSNNDCNITTSNLPSTTIDSIKVDVNDTLTLIDTPGILDDGDIINYITSDELKKIIPKREIKPITLQVKEQQSIIIDSLLRIDIENNDLTMYINDLLDIKRVYKKTDEITDENKYQKIDLFIEEDCDIVVQGLGFIRVKNKCNIVLYTLKGVNVFVRKKLI